MPDFDYPVIEVMKFVIKPNSDIFPTSGVLTALDKDNNEYAVALVDIPVQPKQEEIVPDANPEEPIDAPLN